MPSLPTHTAGPKPSQLPKKRKRQRLERPRKRLSTSQRKKLKDKDRTAYKNKLRKITKHNHINNIVNLSHYDLSNAKKSILSIGLFIPQPKSLDKRDLTTGLLRLRKQMLI